MKNNLLIDNHHDLIKEWDYDKNNDININKITSYSSKKVWWKCENGHSWCVSVAKRTYRGQNCSVCKKNKYLKENSIASKFPNLLEEWDYDKNEIDPNEIGYTAKIKVWWKCKNAHSYYTLIMLKIRGTMCPKCSGRSAALDTCFAYHHPDLIDEWDFDKNGTLTPFNVKPQAHVKIWWKCNKGHSYKTRIACRHNGQDCTYCSGHKLSYETSLLAINPELAKQWNTVKNGDLKPNNVFFKSSILIWWQCEQGHEWKAQIASRYRGSSCPYCLRRKICNDNCLQTLYPNIAEQWHPTKNGNITPIDVGTGTNNKYWWLCEKGHEWETSIVARTKKNSGCLYCVGHLVDSSNSFGDLYPKLAKKWDNKKNKDLTAYNVVPSSHKVVWWKCKKGHNWKAKICNITRGTDCPYCSGGSFSKIALKWINEVCDSENIVIKHAMNGGEYEIKHNNKIMKVDGYCEETNTVYEFHGCFFHGHMTDGCKLRRWNENDHHPKNKKKTYGELYNETLEREKVIKDLGYNLIVMWECDYKK